MQRTTQIKTEARLVRKAIRRHERSAIEAHRWGEAQAMHELDVGIALMVDGLIHYLEEPA